MVQCDYGFDELVCGVTLRHQSFQGLIDNIERYVARKDQSLLRTVGTVDECVVCKDEETYDCIVGGIDTVDDAL